MEVFQGLQNSRIKNIGKGVLITFLTSIILLAILSLILAYTDVSEKIVDPAIIVITAISTILGGIVGSIKIKKNGLLNGGIIGGIYICLIYLLSSIANWNFNINIRSLIMIIMGIGFGIIGGIIGVNKR